MRSRRKPGLMPADCRQPVWSEWAVTIWVLQSKVNSRGGKASTDTVWFKAGKWAAALTLLNGVSWRDPWAWPSSTRLRVFANFIWGGRRVGGMFSRGEKTSPVKAFCCQGSSGKIQENSFLCSLWCLLCCTEPSQGWERLQRDAGLQKLCVFNRVT